MKMIFFGEIVDQGKCVSFFFLGGTISGSSPHRKSPKPLKHELTLP